MDTRFRDQCHDRLLGLPTNFGTKLTFPNTGTWAATARFLWGTETGRNSMASETPRQKRITGRVIMSSSTANSRAAVTAKAARPLPSHLRKPAPPDTRASPATVAIFAAPRRRKQRDEQVSRSARASPTSERTGIVRVHARWQDGTPAAQLHVVGRPPPPGGLASPTAIPGKSFTPRRS